MKKGLLLFCLLLAGTFSRAEKNKAIVVVPVADLVGSPLEMDEENVHSYHTLPWSCYRSHYEANKRMHQILFHEIVDIVDKRGNEVLIEIPNVYFQVPQSNAPQKRYWTHASNLFPLRHISLKENHDARIPSQEVTNSCIKTVSLIRPWQNTKLGMHFSIGTRFIMKNKSPGKYTTVHFFNPKIKKMDSMSILSSHLYFPKQQSPREKISDFTALLRLWAQNKIPYVLGGCSHTISVQDNNHELDKKKINGSFQYFYVRPHVEQKIKSGLDCSGMMVRAAQIVGMPYPYKNTTTLSDKLRSLARHESLENGDLIWVPGHVLMVSDVKNNLAIEAHSYDGGYGVIHEKPLNQLFKNINSYKDLLRSYLKGEILSRLNSKMEPYLSYKHFKILKMASIWSR